jgi:uncharacterized membrane protein YozB (DUF420 family)
MSDVSASQRLVAPQKNKFSAVLKPIALAAIFAAALAFVLKYVFRYYLHYNQAAFIDPMRGAANYWVMRGWLLTHVTAGMVALLAGPWQFWTGFRARFARLHRWTGRIFLCAVAVGCVAAIRMAFATTFGWAFGFALVILAVAWATTSGMAYYAILKRQVAIHKEWMARAYVTTFAFVTFRVLNDYYPGARLQPYNDRMVTFIWLSWVLPLLVLEVILQLRRMRRPAQSTR